jgi:hypothetical protein
MDRPSTSPSTNPTATAHPRICPARARRPLRWALYEAAQVARGPRSPDRAYCEQAAERLGGNRACLALARKLLKRWWRVTATTATGAPPRPDGNSGRCACPKPQTAGSAGTAGTLPTFTHQPVGRVGAQLYPEGIVARYRNPARDLDRPNSHQTGKRWP